MEESMETIRTFWQRRMAIWALAGAAFSLASGCGAGNAPAPPPPCEQDCQDNIALRALRESMRLAYNILLQGKPVGKQDQRAPCPLGVGTIHIFGNADSNDLLGTTTVDLTFDYQNCKTSRVHATPERNYTLVLTGAVTEKGVLVMSTGTTALTIQSAAMTFQGTVHDPMLPYDQVDCEVTATQDGNNVSGSVCGRTAGFTGF
jgi:hypothetical protein